MEPDLVAVVRHLESGEETRFPCFSQILASYSKYVEVALTKFQEAATMEIGFPDTTPAEWEKALRFLKPGGSFGMKLGDMREVLPFYTRFEFHSGLDMCDAICADVLSRYRWNGNKNRFSYDDCDSVGSGNDGVEAAKLSLQFNLEGSRQAAKVFARFYAKLQKDEDIPYEHEDYVYFFRCLDIDQADDKEVLNYMAARALWLRDSRDWAEEPYPPQGRDVTDEQLLDLIQDEEEFLSDYCEYRG